MRTVVKSYTDNGVLVRTYRTRISDERGIAEAADDIRDHLEEVYADISDMDDFDETRVDS